jgi:starch synthase
MRILIVDQSPVAWGAEITILRMALEYEAGGHRVTLLGPDGPFASEWRAAGLEFEAWADRPLQGTDPGGQRQRASAAVVARSMTKAVGELSSLVRVARQHDVLHSNSLWAHPEVALAGRLARRPTLLDLHDVVAPGLGKTILEGAIATADMTVPVSEAVAATIRPSLRRRLRVIHRGVDLERFAPGDGPEQLRAELQVPETALLVGIVGRLDAEKGVDKVIEAVDRVGRTKDVFLAVVGTASDDGSYQREVQALGDRLLGARVRFLGKRDDVPEIMSQLDVLVNASDAEPLGGVILEGQASGVPVVAYATGGSPELIDHGVDGVLVSPSTADALADALDELYDDRAYRERLGKAARDRVESRSSWAACCRKFEDAYETVLRTHRRPHT